MTITELQGKRLKSLINQKRLKMYEFAEKVDVAPATLSRIISGKQTVSDAFLERCAEALQVSVAYLCMETDDTEPQNIVKRNKQLFLDNMEDYQTFSNQYAKLCRYLETLGVSMQQRVIIPSIEVQLQQKPDKRWYPITAAPEYMSKGFDEKEIETELMRFDTFDLEIDVVYQGHLITMTHEEVERWFMRIITGTEYMLMDKFNTDYYKIPAIPTVMAKHAEM